MKCGVGMQYDFSERIKGLKPSAIREILKHTSDPKVIPFAAGNPAPEAFPAKEIEAIVREIFQGSPILALQYSITEGYSLLREAVKKDIHKRYGIGRDLDDTVIVSGAQQGIDLATKVFCNSGDTVICESPSFIGSLNAFRSYGVKLCGIPMESDGISIECLERALKTEKNVKMIYTIPNFQNPSGITTSLEKRKVLYQLALKHKVIILEDNPYGELYFGNPPASCIKSLDSEGIVIYCGSFSKVLAPGMRVGYVTASRDIISKMVVAKQTSDVHTNILAQLIAYKFLTECDFDGHLEKIRAIYRKKSALMLESINTCLAPDISYNKPSGGLFIWCTLPDGVDMLEFCKNAVQKGVAVVPGTAFLIDEAEACQSFRLNFSTPTDEQIVRGVEILGNVFKEMK